METIKVGSQSPTHAVAGAIANTYREHNGARVQAIGAGAVNQAIKALIYAKQFLAEEGKAIVFKPAFIELELDGRTLTGIHLSVQPEPADTQIDELVPIDTETRQGSAYLLREETAVDHVAVPANADAISERMDSYTTDEAVQETFAERQKMAPSGRAQLSEELDEHNSESPILSGGDIDARWQDAGVGEETVGGENPTPDQDVVDEIGEALGITYEDEEPLDPEKMEKRDENRWELNPDSRERRSQVENE